MKPITFDIRRMIQLRLDGWSYSALGREFHKDHTTILYHCKRLGIEPNLPKPENIDTMTFYIEEALPGGEVVVPKVAPKYAHLLEERLNVGKSYKEYLAEALKRPIERRYHEIYYTNYGVTSLATRTKKEGSEDNAESAPVV